MTHENKTQKTITLPRPNRTALLKYLVVLGMGCAGTALMMAGGLAWVAGENIWFMTAFVAGSIFAAAGGIGFVTCLDGEKE